LVDAIELMVAVLSDSREDVLLVSTVDAEGFVGPGDCFSLDKGPPSPEVLFELTRRTKAAGILCGSRATRSVFDPDEADTQLFEHLLSESMIARVLLIEHLLVKEHMVRFMREAAGLEPLLEL
jgi:hypothetical protein